MADTVTFDSTQTLKLPQEDSNREVDTLDITRWIESGDSGSYKAHCYVDGIRFPIKDLLKGDQSRLTEILDGEDSDSQKRIKILKEAIEGEDYSKRCPCEEDGSRITIL
jgi:hypothetical protein